MFDLTTADGRGVWADWLEDQGDPRVPIIRAIERGDLSAIGAVEDAKLQPDKWLMFAADVARWGLPIFEAAVFDGRYRRILTNVQGGIASLDELRECRGAVFGLVARANDPAWNASWAVRAVAFVGLEPELAHSHAGNCALWASWAQPDLQPRILLRLAEYKWFDGKEIWSCATKLN